MSTRIESPSERQSLFTTLLVSSALTACLFGAFLFGRYQARQGVLPAFERRLKLKELATEMQQSFHVAAEAEKHAVMAETDSESEAFASEVRQATDRVEQLRKELSQLITLDGTADEVARLKEFENAWKRYQELDQQILELAVANTNLKAMQLSITTASESLDRMEAALKRVIAASAASAAGDVEKAALRALNGAFRIHSLQSAHIAEPSEAVMDRMESRMKQLDGEVNEQLGQIALLANQSEKPEMEEAQAAYRTFQQTNAEILTLSRRNTNVRSNAMSLGEKRYVTARCRELLNSLQAALEVDPVKASR